jgi:hypothetical protein
MHVWPPEPDLVQNFGIVANMTARGWCTCENSGRLDNPNGKPDPRCSVPTEYGQPAVQGFLKENKIEKSPVGLTAPPRFNPGQLPATLKNSLKLQ